MFPLIDEYLRLLCVSCGFRSARLLVFAPGDSKRVKIIDRGHYRGRGSDGTGNDSDTQIPFVFHEDCDDGDMRSGRTEMNFKLSCRHQSWVLETAGALEKSFKSTVNDLTVELRVVCDRAIDGSSSHGLTSAEGFLYLLESVVDVAGIRYSYDNPGFLFSACPEKERSCEEFDPPLFGTSQVVRVLKGKIRNVARSSIPVLIEGENGTGKEIAARNIHHLGGRSAGSMVIINCMELPPSLLQSELFGHIKGSFTGAMNDRKGLIESAEGGTFFLDEIGEMPLHLQAALLRVIQEKEIRRVGESQRRVIDVRFVFATNRDLAGLVKKGKFREDLYYRIKGVRIHLPPLRSRKEDILLLAGVFISSACRKTGRTVPRISAGAAREILAYHWPGNVRELKNEVERVLALYPDIPMIFPEMLSGSIRNARNDIHNGLDLEGETLPEAVNRLELKMIKNTLRHFSGNRTRSAAVLGITRQGLLKKMKRHALTEKEF